jgi:hypothetical protein
MAEGVNIVEWLGLVCLAVLGAIALVFDARARAWRIEIPSQSYRQQVEKVETNPAA